MKEKFFGVSKILFIVLVSTVLMGCIESEVESTTKYSVKKIFDIDTLGTSDESTSWNIISTHETYLVAEQRYNTLSEEYSKQIVKFDLKTKTMQKIFVFEDKKCIIMSAETDGQAWYITGFERIKTGDEEVGIKSFVATVKNENLTVLHENWIESPFETDLLYEYDDKVYAFLDTTDTTSNQAGTVCSQLFQLVQSDLESVYKDCDGFYPRSLRSVEISSSGFILFEIRNNDPQYEFRSVAVGFEGQVRGIATYSTPVNIFVELDNKLITTYWDVENTEVGTDVSMVDVSDLNGENVTSAKLLTPKNSEKPNVVYHCEPINQKTMFCNTAYDVFDSNYQTMASNPYIVTLVNNTLKFQELKLKGVYPTHNFTRINDEVAYMGTYAKNDRQETVYTIFELRKDNEK